MTTPPKPSKPRIPFIILIVSGCVFLACLFSIFGAIGQKLGFIPTGTPVISAVVTNQIDTAIMWTSTPEIPTAIPETLTPAATPDQVELLKTRIMLLLGESNRKVNRISEFQYDPTTLKISITVAAQDNLTNDLIKIGIYKDIVDVLQSVAVPPDYKIVAVTITFPLADVYGNTKEANVVEATYTRETIEKVNWPKFITDNILKIAEPESLYIHPVMMK